MNHEECQFQHLAASAVSGQLSDLKSIEFGDHLVNCQSCLQRVREMEAANIQMFLLVASQVKESKISSGIQRRFVVRATHAGVPFATEPAGILRPNLLQVAALIVAVCLFIGLGRRQIAHQQLNAANTVSSYSKVERTAPVGGLEIENGRDLAKPMVVDQPLRRPRRRKNLVHGTERVGQTPYSGHGSETLAKSLFRLNPEFVTVQSRIHRPGSELRGGRELSAGYFKAVGEAPPAFSLPDFWSPHRDDGIKQRVFHYTSTLASLSLQNDQAIFTLRPVAREVSFSGTSDLIRFR